MTGLLLHHQAGLTPIVDVPEVERVSLALVDAGYRAITPHMLVATGVAGALTDQGDDADVTRISRQLLEYLSDGTVDSYRAIALDISQDGIPNGVRIGDWEVWCPDADDLDALSPVPTAASYASDPWPKRVVTGHALLRRADEPYPRGKMRLRIPRSRQELSAWFPLFVLNVYDQHVVKAHAEFDIHVGDYVQRYGDGVPGEYEPYTDYRGEIDGWYFRIYNGDFDVDDSRRQRFVDFCQAITEMHDAILAQPKLGHLVERFERAAKQFVLANGDSWGQGRSDGDHRDDVTLRYTIALEALLSNANQELRRMVAQRAAVLLGDAPSTAIRVYDAVSQAYNHRSRYVHGESPSALSLPALRNVVRHVMLRWLAATQAWADRIHGSPQGKGRAVNSFYSAIDDSMFESRLRFALVELPFRNAFDLTIRD